MESLMPEVIKLDGFIAARGSVFLLAAGIALVLAGWVFSPYKRPFGKKGSSSAGALSKVLVKVIDRITSVFPFSLLKARLLANPVFAVLDSLRASLLGSLLCISSSLSGFLLLALLYRPGVLWYVKLLFLAISFFLPWYTVFLLLDIYHHHVEKQIPQFIDEFRGAFVKHRKIKPALLESCSYIDKSLGRIICRSADGVFMDKSLEALKQKINNVWFSIFVILLLNYKENGGELVDQLYKLNRTMSRYVNIEKKRSRRLIWYEVFALSTAAFSIPCILWFNGMIAGGTGGPGIAASSFSTARLICFSILSLLIVRLLRRI